MLKVKYNNLILFTGIIWLIASTILLRRAYCWIELITHTQLITGIILAIIITFVKSYYIFRKLNLRNIKRIKAFKPQSISIWEFHPLKDKLLIMLMIVLGIALRHSPIVPKYILFPIYLGIGISMFYVCILYFTTHIKAYSRCTD
ncbi:MAG: hypothetical protein U9R32_00975 [Bacteroidota bacterium]|nr:hypothetical protein [Bacteroidota bacterium]